jgi:hypothetical protein
MIYIINLIAALILLLSTSADQRAMIEPEPAPSIVIEIEYRSPCEEDEGWITVDHRDPLSTLDGSVSRRCINLDEIAHYLSHQRESR